MEKNYESPNAELIYYAPAETIMDQDANPSFGDSGQDWGPDNQ